MFHVGVDLGKRHDFTAIAIAETQETPMPWIRSYDERVLIRHLERVALGTPYTGVARRVEAVVRALNGHCRVAVDATGLGAPVVDALREGGLECELTAVVMTGGERANRSGGLWHVPKQDLVGGLQMLLEKGELRIARRLREAGTLVRELLDVRWRETKSGGRRYGADGAGEHDDLVMAAALACWDARRPGIGWGGGRLPGI